MALSFEQQLDGLIKQFQPVPGGLMPLLHAVQKTFGHVPPESVGAIASGMGLSRAEVHGVISFYHDFHTKPQGRHTVQICRAEACQAVGARQLETHAKRRLGVEFGETSADGSFTLVPVYCLGNCACGPSVRIGDDIFARVSNDRFDQLLDSRVGED